MKSLFQRFATAISAAWMLTSAFSNEVQIEAGRLLVSGLEATKIQVFVKGAGQPLFGESKSTASGIAFVPAVPFVQGRGYHIELEGRDGSKSQMDITFEAKGAVAPSVRLSPPADQIPANTLKLYLDFSHQMEQGEFLRQISLRQKDGEEVVGAFRETELWSPDGKRLTIMFHPGRQKTGVNLNVDEGPVLVEGRSYKLVIAGQWRSVDGVPLGYEAVFELLAAAADHEQPNPSKWHLSVPLGGSRDSLTLTTDELFEPDIFRRSIRFDDVSGKARVEILSNRQLRWSFLPDKPWAPGEHVISVDSDLEDLAGNSPQKPFEVDLTAESPKARAQSITFGISERK